RTRPSNSPSRPLSIPWPIPGSGEARAIAEVQDGDLLSPRSQSASRSRSRTGTRRKTSSQPSLLDSRSFVSSLGCLASLNLPKNSFAKCNLAQVLEYAKGEGRLVLKASNGRVMMSCSKSQCSSNLTST
ncbi:unnamed protein product, partial [Musa acuminata subsp. burmannicoides]